MTTRIGLLSALGVLLCSATQLFAQTDYPVPFVNKPLVPETAAPGGRGFILTVNGTGFSAQSVVKWNGSALPTVFVNDTQLTARIAASDIATASTAVVTVVNPGPLSHISNPVTFGITTPEPSIVFQSSSIPVGGPLTAADLNGDGIPDLVTLSGTTVYVALGTGGGQFGPTQSYPVSAFPGFIAVGDFSGARKPDLAVAGTSGVEILPNNGNGTFGPVHRITDIDLNWLATGDLNGDGYLDLVGTSPSGAVYVMLYNPTGGFLKAVPYAVGADPVSVVVGDFNHDGFLDLAALNFDDSISVLLGNGDGTFQPQTVYPTGGDRDFPTALVTADFNGDGNLDLVRSASLDPAGIGILLGNGDGTFQPVQITPGSGYGLAAGDFNGDGKLDLAVGTNGTGAGILLGNGNGTFQSWQYFSSLGFVLAAADFNQDGRLDIAIETETSEGSGVYMILLLLQ